MPKHIQTINCPICRKDFQSERQTEIELDDYGDPKAPYYYYPDVCPSCEAHLKTVDNDSKEWAERNYKLGLITRSEFERAIKGK
jgi:Zn-finger nucleic acid-binding protein